MSLNGGSLKSQNLRNFNEIQRKDNIVVCQRFFEIKESSRFIISRQSSINGETALARSLRRLSDAQATQRKRLDELQETMQKLGNETRRLESRLRRYQRALASIDMNPLEGRARRLARMMDRVELAAADAA